MNAAESNQLDRDNVLQIRDNRAQPDLYSVFKLGLENSLASLSPAKSKGHGFYAVPLFIVFELPCLPLRPLWWVRC